MDNESSLLAYLVPRLTSRGEDTATDSLAFILNKSEACRGALDSLLREQGFNLEPIARFDTQVTHEDGSRPDMVGYDGDGNKRVLVESKFWAALLEGQASGYFSQLEASEPGVLLFIAPGTRIETLWAEIKRQMETSEDPAQLESGTTLERMRTARAGTDKLLMLASWDLLLDRMAAAVSADSQLASDIQQLRGFVDEQDLDAFHPLQRAELNPSLARRIRWFNQLIDDVLVQAVEQRWVSTRGFRATALWAGYWRNFRFVSDLDRRTSHKFSICVDLNLWAEAGDTPIWIWAEIVADPDRRLRDSDVTVSEDAGWLYMPVHLKTGVEYQHVLEDALLQLRRIAEIVVS